MSRLSESKNADAVSHRKRFVRNASIGFIQKRFYLGDDIIKKMVQISKELTGEELDPAHMNSESAADVIGTCINLMYNTLFSDDQILSDTSQNFPPKIEPPMSPNALKKYKLYQQLRGRFNVLATGDKDKQKWKSVANYLKENEIKKPKYSKFSDGEWSLSDVELIARPEIINELIIRDNEKFKARKDSLLSEPEV
ncbi:hypothetical protein E0U70_11760 [Salmonella enterica subsp. enterica serovar Gloucester]|nr:hypothetical protein [Salmonella enterica subsp. enterica serovar Gloucester]